MKYDSIIHKDIFLIEYDDDYEKLVSKLISIEGLINAGVGGEKENAILVKNKILQRIKDAYGEAKANEASARAISGGYNKPSEKPSNNSRTNNTTQAKSSSKSSFKYKFNIGDQIAAYDSTNNNVFIGIITDYFPKDNFYYIDSAGEKLSGYGIRISPLKYNDRVYIPSVNKYGKVVGLKTSKLEIVMGYFEYTIRLDDGGVINPQWNDIKRVTNSNSNSEGTQSKKPSEEMKKEREREARQAKARAKRAKAARDAKKARAKDAKKAAGK